MKRLVTAVKPLVSVSEVVLVGRLPEVADDVGEVAEHDVVVVRLGVQEALVSADVQAVLDLGDEPLVDHVGQLGQRLGPLLQEDGGKRMALAVGLGQVEQALAALDGQIDEGFLHVGVGDGRRARSRTLTCRSIRWAAAPRVR